MKFVINIKTKDITFLVAAVIIVFSVGYVIAQIPNPGHPFTDIECTNCIGSTELDSAAVTNIIKANDGTGSGIDADLIDGIDSLLLLQNPVTSNTIFQGTTDFRNNMLNNDKKLIQVIRLSGENGGTKQLSNSNFLTGFHEDDWYCFSGGLAFTDGDINENDAGTIIRAETCKGSNDKWFGRFDFRTHKNDDFFVGHFVCVNKVLVDLPAGDNC